MHKLKQYILFENRNIDSYELLENQGYCNENYLLHSEGKKYIVRKFIRTDIDRKFEFQVQKLAFEKAISAEPLLLDEENALSISTYVEGIHKDQLENNDLNQFAEVLKKLHSLKLESEPILIETLIEGKSKEVQDALITIDTFESETVLCHNDLNPHNILFTQTIKLIDWEYAGMNDRYFDLASVCVEFDLTKEDEEHFLRSYFTMQDDIKYEKLKAYKVIYKALCTQWFENLEREA
ncbi:MAG: phosphotransferase family protein [Sulfurovum sp.]|nr:phosphotransferase family protein [Sulfurovum sp.]